MKRHESLRLLVLLAPCVGCASHGTAHVAPNESVPHITWEIRRGGDTGDAEVVCGSEKQAAPCVLPASTPDRRSLTTVHVYLHGIGQPVTYVGKIEAPFVQDSEKLGEVARDVPAGSEPVGVTIAAGVVTTKPGSYTLSVGLNATPQGGTPVKVAEDVPVTVK